MTKHVALVALVMSLAGCGATPTVPVAAAAKPAAALMNAGAGKGISFQSTGDPHEVSGDGCAYENQLTGVFTKLKSTVAGDLEMQVSQVKQVALAWGPTVRWNTAVGIRFSNNGVATLVTYYPHIDELRVDGLILTKAVRSGTRKVNGGTLTFTAGSPTFSVTSPKADIITIAPQRAADYGYPDPRGWVAYSWVDLYGQIGNRVAGDIRGELGTFDHDGNKYDDLRLRNGALVGCPTNPTAFEEDWRPGVAAFIAEAIDDQ